MTVQEALNARRGAVGMVIFDCDGVLVDSEPLANRVCAACITAAGWPMSGHECEQRFVGLNLEAMVPVIEANLGRTLPPDWVQNLTTTLVEVLGRESTPIPGAIAAVHGVSALGLPWRVASNSSHPEMNAKFACLGLTSLVSGRLHSYTDVAHGKPAPDLFLAAAAAQAMPPARCIVIEDSVTGARAAAAAGMFCLGYAPHDDGARLRAEGAHPFHDMAVLPALLAEAMQ